MRYKMGHIQIVGYRLYLHCSMQKWGIYFGHGPLNFVTLILPLVGVMRSFGLKNGTVMVAYLGYIYNFLFYRLSSRFKENQIPL